MGVHCQPGGSNRWELAGKSLSCENRGCNGRGLGVTEHSVLGVTLRALSCLMGKGPISPWGAGPPANHLLIMVRNTDRCRPTSAPRCLRSLSFLSGERRLSPVPSTCLRGLSSCWHQCGVWRRERGLCSWATPFTSWRSRFLGGCWLPSF